MKRYIATVVLFLFLFASTGSSADRPSSEPYLRVTEQGQTLVDHSYVCATGTFTIRSERRHRIHTNHRTGTTTIYVFWQSTPNARPTQVDMDVHVLRGGCR